MDHVDFRPMRPVPTAMLLGTCLLFQICPQVPLSAIAADLSQPAPGSMVPVATAPPGACSSGAPTLTLLVFVRCPPAAWDSAFGNGHWLRTVKSASGLFTAATAVSVLAQTTGAAEEDFEVAVGGSSVSNSPAAELRTNVGGDGLVFIAQADSLDVGLTVCPVERGALREKTRRARLVAKELALVGVHIDEEPYACVIQSVVIHGSGGSGGAARWPDGQRQAFSASLRERIKQLVPIGPSEPPPWMKLALSNEPTPSSQSR